MENEETLLQYRKVASNEPLNKCYEHIVSY